MKIAIAENHKKDNTRTYVEELLKYLTKKYGHELIEEDHAELIGLSMSHISQFGELKKLREKYPEKKIIVGGHAANAARALLRYADFINLGHGFEFFEQNQKIDDLYGKSYIMTKGKKDYNFSQYIDWSKIPVVQIGENSFSYLWSVGCKKKCKFCLTSWLNKYQKNPEGSLVLKRIRNKIGKSKQLYVISNDFSESYAGRNVADVLVSDFLRNPLKFKNVKLIRCGVEFAKEENRRKYAKPISNEEIRKLIRLTKKMGKRMNIFMIAGLETEQDYLDFGKDVLEPDYDTNPKIGFIFNYLSPQKLTPLENFNLENIIEVNLEKIKYWWKIRNGRVVIFHSNTLRPYNAIKYSICERANEETIDAAWGLVERRHESLEALWQDINRLGLSDLAKGIA